ncbi:MAG: hypothetical protein DWQ31_09345 [Planctomycetota bacterium]|nr:MAG: hypothetical protein DWQ31_09345 [Planctomycetota bacterium]REJ91349.1 MAG: hypothetical protein DWQ35_14420 [Planctomycetota bacterium]REK18532.1 MAG: hypothetical protein DWQ42_20265 [Planctomycetota bacterium]REK39409.1 MAG: hypothetical protein DWQ46_19240 [Planctomycetota bacterium]
MGVMTWIIALVVLALLPGPKKLGISSVLAILAFFAMRPLAYPSEQALQVLICVGLEVTAFVLWVYLAIRAVLAGNSSNIRLGILSLLGLLSPMGLTMLLRIWAAIAIQLGLSSDIRYNPFYWLLSILWY